MTEQIQQRNEDFRRSLHALNAAQRQAVEQIEGPVLVVAGPGTGKTQLLAARIGNILLQSDARAQNILCLTFTDAGTTAMRQRLLGMIGPEAQRLPIFTFHAFCNRVIQDNAEYFGKGDLEPASELERIEMVRQLLLKLPTEHPLRIGRKDVFQFEVHLRELFSTMKKEGWTPGWVLKKCEEFLKGLPENPHYIYQRNGKHFKKGMPKTAQIEAVTEKINRLKTAADLYPKFLHAMERAGRYEYEDMLLWVTRAFEQHPALLRSYQERYLYILVDEFQDTNGAQFQLINLLLDFWETPNIFIVGDDDQSIYEFQGARLQNLREFQDRYARGLKTLLLEENYRSGQAILDAAGKLIEHNALRAVNLFEGTPQKRLQAQADRKGQLALHRLPNRMQEAIYIVQQIETLIQQGAPAEEIAVLYARHRQADRLLDLLEKKGIPYQTKRPANVLDLPLVQHLRSLLSFLQDEMTLPFSGEHRLFRLLHAAFWDLPELDLAKIALACRQEQIPPAEEVYLKIGARSQSRKYWRELLTDSPALRALDLASPERFETLGHCLNAWIADAQNLPLSPLLERIFAQSGLLAWALKQTNRRAHLQALNSFAAFVRNETMRAPRLTLGRFLAILDSMDDNSLPLPLQAVAQFGGGVQLLTAHAAKGLEFRFVFMFDCVEDAWDKNSGHQRGRFFLPETLTRSGEEDALEARRRLFYVAMTRAKEQLLLSFAQSDDSGKPLVQSRFVAESGLPPVDQTLAEETLLEAQALWLLEAPPPTAMLPDPALLDAMLQEFSLSVTAFHRYLRCPLAFYYEDVLKISGAPSEAAAFGMAMHGALQQFVLKMKSHKKLEWPSAEQLLKMFAREMERQRGFFSENGFEQRLVLGRENLRRIWAEQVPHWRKRAIVERRIDRVEIKGTPLTGVLDKIEWLDNGTLRIVDYKTGAPDVKKTAPPDESQPLGGEYWRQLAFYKILLDNAQIFPETVSKTAIAWLEPDKRGVFPVTEIQYSSEELRFVENLVAEVYAQLRARKFDTGCGKSDCPWCEMQRSRKIPPSFRRDAEDGLDDGDSGAFR